MSSRSGPDRAVPPLRIGLTYDLREEYLARGYSEEETAELDQPGTIEALAETLGSLGHAVERIGHVEALAARLLAGERWDLVWNIAEGLHGLGREAMIPCLLDHWCIPYTFSDPLVMALSLHKGRTKQILRDVGLPTAPFVVVEQVDDLRLGQYKTLGWPLFVKPIAEGTGKGVSPASIVHSSAELEERCGELLERYRQPVLVETLLPGRDLTVGILGSGAAAEAIGTLDVVLLPGAEPGVYSYVNKERCEDLVEYRRADPEDPLVRQSEEVALAAWRALGCLDAGRVDLRCDAQGEPQVLEINPLAGLHPEHSDLPILCTLLGIPYRDLLARIVDSAWQRARGRSGNGGGRPQAVGASVGSLGG